MNLQWSQKIYSKSANLVQIQFQKLVGEKIIDHLDWTETYIVFDDVRSWKGVMCERIMNFRFCPCNFQILELLFRDLLFFRMQYFQNLLPGTVLYCIRTVGAYLRRNDEKIRNENYLKMFLLLFL